MNFLIQERSSTTYSFLRTLPWNYTRVSLKQILKSIVMNLSDIFIVNDHDSMNTFNKVGIMSWHDYGFSFFFTYFYQIINNLLAYFGVEVCQGVIEKHYWFFRVQCPGKSYPGFLAFR